VAHQARLTGRADEVGQADDMRQAGMVAPGEVSLALVRHGESTWIAERRFQGGADPALSERGQRQARALAARVVGPQRVPFLPLPIAPPIGVWHSPLRRAASTAGAILAGYGDGRVPAHVAPELVELSQGAWEGLSHDEVETRYGDDLAAWRADAVLNPPTSGETLEAGIGRARPVVSTVVAALDRAAPEPDSPPWGIIVAHEGILRLILLDLLEISQDAYWSFPFSLASVTVLERRTGRWRLRAHNLDEHLTEVG
jgi:broad specificity phosphatase PhoE